MAPYVPVASYRIQFSPSFTFQQAQEIVPYLTELGISDLYASPIFQARPGSGHGYDVVDPGQINQELGGREGFEALEQQLQEVGIGWIQDIVPNHMAYDWHNLFLRDVLESGAESDYYDFFDVNWKHSYMNIQDRLLAPFLGRFYNECLEAGEIQLHYDQDGFTINYYQHRYPLRIDSYVTVFTHYLRRLRNKLKKKDPHYVRLLAVLYSLKSIPSKEDLLERKDQLDFVKDTLWELYNTSPDIKQFIDDTVDTFNGKTKSGDPNYDLLDNLISEQFFNLSFWKVGADEINYRRFFTVNDLISLRIQDERVFQKTHSLILDLVEQEKFTGLRVDHIDGLHNPTEYLERLRHKSDQVYIVAEKILESEETLPTSWPIQGTTGYDFLIKTNSLFCQTSNEATFTQIYGDFTGLRYSFTEIGHDKKRLIINRTLTGDVDNLAYLLKQIGSRHRYANDFTLYSLRRAIIEVLVFFPVYRVYVQPDGSLDEVCGKHVLEAIRRARANQKNLLRELTLIENELTFIERLLLLEYEGSLTSEEKAQWVDFVRRTQQLTGPLMAKGIEDTAFYVYNRLISLNEVGGDPGRFGIEIEEFHQFNQARAQQWPHAMNTLATHDTKRGEDVRARINVLSEIPEEWQAQLQRWNQANLKHKQIGSLASVKAPDVNDEYFLYQTLIGSFPFFSGNHPEYHQRYYIDFIDRVKAYINKAVREAKVHTDWLNNDTVYEEAATHFAEQLLTPSEDNTFLSDFLEFQKKIQHYGIFNSLSQTLIKLTAPGLPDLYRGNEFWDLSMVDPDNRRPVDFASLQTSLKLMQNREPLKLISELLSSRIDGRIKQYVIHRALQIRKQHLDLFQQGEYLSLETKGTYPDHVVAFARQTEEDIAITIVPRLLTHLVGIGEDPLGEAVWQDTQIMVPRGKRSWVNALTGEEIETNGKLAVGEALAHFPAALLVRA